eukprot:scaffold9336_cov77-Phaeocystis_antarctica.AAC.3
MRDARAAASCSCVPLPPRLPSQRCSRPRLRGVHRAADTNQLKPAKPWQNSDWMTLPLRLSKKGQNGSHAAGIIHRPIRRKRERTTAHRRRRAARGGIVWRPCLLQRTVGAVQIEATTMRSPDAPHDIFSPKLEPATVKEIIQKAIRVKNDRKKMQILRMSFVSMGCTLSSRRRRPGANTTLDNVWGTAKHGPSKAEQQTLDPCVQARRRERRVPQSALRGSRLFTAGGSGAAAAADAGHAAADQPRQERQHGARQDGWQQVATPALDISLGPRVDPCDGVGGRCNGARRLAQAAQPVCCTRKVAVVVTRHLEQLASREDAAIAYDIAVARTAVVSRRCHRLGRLRRGRGEAAVECAAAKLVPVMSKPHGAFQCAGGHCPIARHVRRDCEGGRTGRRPAGGATLADAITKRECLYGVGHEEVGRHAHQKHTTRNQAGDQAETNQA